MKKASGFEIVAARCWNLLNEGSRSRRYLRYRRLCALPYGTRGEIATFWALFGIGLFAALPMFTLVFCIMIFLCFFETICGFRSLAALVIWRDASLDLGLYGTGSGCFCFFTIYFWGTFYYHLRIGTSWWNFRRFWKLVLKNSDSTSGNAQEQMPKFLLLLFVVDVAGQHWAVDGAMLSADFTSWELYCVCDRSGSLHLGAASESI